MKKNILLFIVTIAFALSANAYEFENGDMTLKAAVGASVNVIRYDAVTKETPFAGMPISGEFEYFVSDAFSLGGAIRPMFADGFVDLGIAIGSKYRLTNQGTPLLPYAGVSLTAAWLLPTKIGTTHMNLGIRPCVGFDYFVMRNFAVGIELATEPSIAFISNEKKFELSMEVLLGFSWRL